MSELQYHCQLSRDHIHGKDNELNYGIGRYFFIPGAPARVIDKIAEKFEPEGREGPIVNSGRRDYYTMLGWIKSKNYNKTGEKIYVGAINSQIGVSATALICDELFTIRLDRLLRVGTAGSLQDDIMTGDVVVATGADRDEYATRSYVPADYPKIVPAHPDYVEASLIAAKRLKMQDKVKTGIVHTKETFRREVENSDLLIPEEVLIENRNYMECLRRSGVLASSMECAVLFTLGQLFSYKDEQLDAYYKVMGKLGSLAHYRESDMKKYEILLNHLKSLDDKKGRVIKTGSLLAIVGDNEASGGFSLEKEHEKHMAEIRAVDLAIATVQELYEIDKRKRGIVG